MSVRDEDGKMQVGPVANSVVLDGNCSPASDWKPGQISTEVVVVGTGAGGAIAGTELAKAGKKVLFLEAGGGYEKKDFARKSLLWSTGHIYAGRGVQIASGDPPILIPSGRCVGGSTVLNSAICFRPPVERLQEWAANVGDDRLLAPAMAPFVDEIWRRIGVSATHEGIGRRNNVLLRDGMAKLGMTHAWMDRNAPGCTGCGICHFGCPSGGKASVDRAILPEAFNHNAEIRTGAQVVGVIIEGGRATGVEVRVLDPETDAPVRLVRVHADRVILSGSALGTPLILEASSAGGEHRGKHLALHPAGAALGEFDTPVVMWDGVPQGYWGVDPAQPNVVVESANAGIAELYGLLAPFGKEGANVAKRLQFMTMGGGMVRDEAVGTVSLADDHRRSIHYDLTPNTMERIKDGLRTTTRIYFAAGAKAVCPLVFPLVFYTSKKEALAAIDGVKKGSDFAHVHASHPQGSCRMGPKTGPHAGVVDQDGKVYGVQDLFVLDGAIFPTTLGVNPQVTIMSLSLALSRRMLA